MKRELALFSALAALFGSAAAFAAPATPEYSASTTGTDLHTACERQRDLQADFCSGYILGVSDSASRGHRICKSIGVGNRQVLAVVKKYLEDHPERWRP